MKISIIIPVFNEGKRLVDTIEKLKQRAKKNNFEIIVVSADEETAEIDDELLVKSQKGRAKQMNIGAKKATGDILLFLHCDTHLPENWDSLILEENKPFDYGCFYKTFDSNHLLLRLNACFTNWRLKLFSSMLGDNAIFVKKNIFEKINGYKDIELMEDIELSNALKSYKIKIIKQPVVTSARRFLNRGVFKTLILMQSIRIAYFLGIHPTTLRKWYR